MVATTALLTDHYELTMLDGLLASGLGERRAVFELFARELPPGRRFGVVAGTARALDAVEAFRFGGDELAWLAGRGFLSAAGLQRLERYRFGGSIHGYREGELWFPGSPVLTVEAPLVEALVLETVLLSILNHDSAVAAAASRMRLAAGERTLLEGGARRTHEQAAVAAARAAYLGGFDATSNLEAAMRYGIPSGGTAAHAFTMAHPDERSAFEAQLAAQGPATTFLVDTYDVDQAIRTVIDVAGTGAGAVRLDSGILADDAPRARAMLDELGATQTRIVASGDVDEYLIADLAGAPIDRYLVGTRVVNGSGVSSAGFVYKLVAIADADGPGAPLRSVAKRSVGKASTGGRKMAHRVLDAHGRATAEYVTVEGDEPPHPPPAGSVRPLQVALITAGERVDHTDVAMARAHHARVRSELDADARSLEDGPPALWAAPAAAGSADQDGAHQKEQRGQEDGG